MPRWVIAFILIFVLLLPSSARAQDPLVLNTLQIGIWPEFDKPSVLLIYQITLSSYPSSVALRIPISAGDPNAVASRQADGSLVDIHYTRQVAGQWSTISFTSPTPEVQVEYYDPGLTKDGVSRHYTYTWPGDYTVNQLTIQVQQPADATNMRISPSLGAGTVEKDSLTYYTQDIGSVSAGQNFQITIDYQKSTDVLTAETLPVQSSAPIPRGTSTELNLQSWIVWVLGILGTGLIVGGVVWFLRSSRQQPLAKSRRQRTRSGAHEAELNASAEAAVYCSQCGKRAMPGDQFCRSCGSPIRNK